MLKKKKKIIEKIESQQKRSLYLYVAFVSEIIEMIKSQQKKKKKKKTVAVILMCHYQRDHIWHVIHCPYHHKSFILDFKISSCHESFQDPSALFGRMSVRSLWPYVTSKKI